MISKLFFERIEELKLLKAGWLDGKGIPLDSEGLNWISDAFDRDFPDDLPLPYLYPTAEGEVRAEWSLQPYELSVNIDLQKRIGYWHALNLDDDTEQTKTIHLDVASAWEWLSGEIRRFVEVNV